MFAREVVHGKRRGWDRTGGGLASAAATCCVEAAVRHVESVVLPDPGWPMITKVWFLSSTMP